MKLRDHPLLRQHNIQTLFEDEHLFAVNKPPNLLVLPDRYNAALPHLAGIVKEAQGLTYVVHRIDKETSGVVLFARAKAAHAALNREFRLHQVRKTYLGLARGKPPNPAGLVDLPVVPSSRHRGLMQAGGDGEPARTGYTVLEQFQDYVLLELRPETGKTHQIRVHLKALGVPLVADPLYGDGLPLLLSSFKHRYRPSGEEKPLIRRTALHALSIRFRHPVERREVEIAAEPPKDFQASLQALRKYGV